MTDISRDINERVVSALKQFQPIGEGEQRAAKLSIEFLELNASRVVNTTELAEYVEEHLYEGPDGERVALVAFAVGVGIGYAAGSLVEYMIDQF